MSWTNLDRGGRERVRLRVVRCERTELTSQQCKRR